MNRDFEMEAAEGNWLCIEETHVVCSVRLLEVEGPH